MVVLGTVVQQEMKERKGWCSKDRLQSQVKSHPEMPGVIHSTALLVLRGGDTLYCSLCRSSSPVPGRQIEGGQDLGAAEVVRPGAIRTFTMGVKPEPVGKWQTAIVREYGAGKEFDPPPAHSFQNTYPELPRQP